MPFTFHSHSGEFCCHAHGALGDVIASAIDKKFHTIGLSEHVPRLRTQDLYPEESHLTPAHLAQTFDAYVQKARQYQVSFRDRINILVGAETEYINPELLALVEGLRARHVLDYLVGSVHHVREIPIDFDERTYLQALDACGRSYDSLFSEYFDAQYELITKLRPEVIGHFDVIRIFAPISEMSFSDRPLVWNKIVRNIQAAVEYGALFEINSRAWKKGLPGAYPQRDVIEELKRQGAKFTISDDSHSPDQVGLHYVELYSYLKELGITELYYLARDDSRGVVVKSMPNALDHPFWALNGYTRDI
ncbi:hypothetical protein EV182_002978 [Spiromyces aspiralis]|uniref:Uncharacterized protein n=1 Tax=Spiromyces aspiralis TaxID=68401 RepID=A0ACC1HTJ4_9FUNG|nr:hypothetical protein EV182_002978 [Spiromyces aspiralis]